MNISRARLVWNISLSLLRVSVRGLQQWQWGVQWAADWPQLLHGHLPHSHAPAPSALPLRHQRVLLPPRPGDERLTEWRRENIEKSSDSQWLHPPSFLICDKYINVKYMFFLIKQSSQPTFLSISFSRPSRPFCHFVSVNPDI